MSKTTISFFLLFIDYQAFSDSAIFKILPLLFLLVIIFDNLVETKKGVRLLDPKFRMTLALTLMIVIGVLSAARQDMSFQFRFFKIITLVTFLLALFSSLERELKKNNFVAVFVKIVYLPIVLYIGLNLGLYFMGIKGQVESIGNGLLFSYFGLQIERVKFFLTTGINAYGSLLGCVLTLSLIGVFVIKKYKKIFLSGLIISSISLLLTDSRGPLIYSILVFLLIQFIYSRTSSPKFLWLIPLVGFIGPIITLSSLALLAQSDYGAALSRSSEDLSTGNARSIIWTIAISDFFTFKPEHHIFGYGEFGQYAAGLSQQWAFVFGDRDGAEYMHPHNTFLSIALDYGYFGLVLFIVFQYSVLRYIKSNWNANKSICLVVLANMMYFNLVGIGETMFGFYYKNIIYVFFMINIFVFMMEYQNNTKKKKKDV
jgi:O-antigen ligase